MPMELEIVLVWSFDPISGKLRDTESGQAYGDEINLVQPGFNSGWNKPNISKFWF